MATKHKQPKPLHSTTATDLAPNETGAPGQHSSVLQHILVNDVTSPTVQASIDTNTETMTLSVDNCNIAIFGQSSTVHHSDCHLLSPNRGEGDLRQADSYVEQIQQMEATADNSVQCLSRQLVSKEESQQKTNTSFGDISLDVEPSLPVIRKRGFLNGPQCEEILKNLELLQDNGKFEHHMRFFNFCLQRCAGKGNKYMEVMANEQQIQNREHCNQVLKKFQVLQENGRLNGDEQLLSLYSRLCTKKEYADMELALIIEQGVSFMYHNQLSKSKLYFTSVIKLGKHCQLRNPKILFARAYFLLAANYSSRASKARNVSTILECLRRSEVLLQNHESPEDWAEMYYNFGIAWMNYMSVVPDDDRNAKARKEMQEKAKTYYERAIAICKKDPRSRVQHKKLTYCHLGLAALLLDCTSTVARSPIKVITSQDLRDATKHLDIVEYQLGNIPRGTRVQVLKTRSDQYYRQGPEMYQLAKDTAQDAFQMARRHGFNTELESLQERIDFLDQLCEDTVCTERVKLLVDRDTSNSGSDSRFETSCSESDENLSENG
ncbi:uncharacterized protein LOC110050954 [Orbicella faveolata]|uniref:uncharacterized protein LOC110050954 n=1 Tax=Orbicella faveolata TaxID=48498 RepID=UPI0009E5D818|nr:uncharacterized protein LOC110050954 [Orbicella faveolata]